MNRKRLWLALALGLVLVLLCAASALAEAADSLKFNMELSSSKFSEPKTITVSFTVTNVGDKEMPGPVTLYYPSGKQVEDFGAPTLGVGSSKNWSGTWFVTQQELEAGKISFIVRYSAYDANGEVKQYATTITKRIQYAGAAPEIAVKRTIMPQVAQEGQEVSVIYEITNKGSADVTSVTIAENSAIAKEKATLGGIPAGETVKHVFTVKMGKKDLTSAGTVSYKAGGKSYESKVDAATIKYGKVNLSASLTADKKGGAPGDIVKLTLKLKNSGTTDFTNVTVTDQNLGTVFSNQTVKAGETLTLEKDLTITETQELLFTVQADDSAGSHVETATGTVKVVATDPTQQIVLRVEATADRDSVASIPGGIVRFTVTVYNDSAVDVSSIVVKAVDTTLYTFDKIPAGESRYFVRDTEISMAGSFQFTANVKDQLGQTISFPSNIIPIVKAAPTTVPTPTPLAIPAEPTRQVAPAVTAAPVREDSVIPEWLKPIAETAKYVLTGLAAVLIVLLAIGAARRIRSRNQSNKAIDHLEGGAYRDYSAAPKSRRRSEIVSGEEERKANAPEMKQAENAAPGSELMAETLQRLYTRKDPEEAIQTPEAYAEAAAGEAAEKAAEAAETAEAAAENAVPAVQSAGEAAHRRRAQR